MKKIILLLIVLFSWSFANSALILKKGWQLIGSTAKITDMQIFDVNNVEQIWHYDAATQKWKGYSPDNTIAQKIKNKGYDTITSLESWHGFWVKSKQEWALTFPTDTSSADGNITLKKGWNLISLPINTVVSPHIFDGKTLWKYTTNKQWEFFDQNANQNAIENFSTISHISNSDGIWVKSNTDQSIQTEVNSAKLHTFDSVETMKAYIKDMVLTNNRHYCGYYPMVTDNLFISNVAEDNAAMSNDTAAPTGAKDGSQSTQSASGTNLQEEGVDESDIIKHDNTNIFYVSQNSTQYNTSLINVTTFKNIINNNLSPITTITINGYTKDLYLVDNKLIVLSSLYSDYTTTDAQIPMKLPSNISTVNVDIYNVANITDIQKISSFKIDGTLNNSRVMDGKLYLITNFTPTVEYSYPTVAVDAPECSEYFLGTGTTDVVPSTATANTTISTDDVTAMDKTSDIFYYDTYKKYARCYNLYIDENNKFYRYDYDNPQISAENLIPYVQKDSEVKQMLISPNTFFAPNKKDQDATITTVSKININDANLEKTTSILGYNNTLYASQNALYLVSNKYPLFYNFDRYQERSVIYKISLDDNLTYQANGFVNGTVLNQFSLSEYEDILRIATTEGNSWQNNTTNSLYTLKQENHLLSIYGVLSGLGKEGEIIRSVRFIGTQGYVVTFKQTDPFYTIDLSDAAAPTKAGELQINGYSSYLHPIDANHILGIGRDATPDGQVVGLKMELFDISNFAQPISVDSYSFGSNYSYSELENNHKALAYLESDQVLGFPYRAGSSYWENGNNYLGVYQITNDKINVFNAILTPNSDYSYSNYERGIIFKMDAQIYVAYFSNGKIAYSTLNDLVKE